MSVSTPTTTFCISTPEVVLITAVGQWRTSSSRTPLNSMNILVTTSGAGRTFKRAVCSYALRGTKRSVTFEYLRSEGSQYLMHIDDESGWFVIFTSKTHVIKEVLASVWSPRTLRYRGLLWPLTIKRNPQHVGHSRQA